MSETKVFAFPESSNTGMDAALLANLNRNNDPMAAMAMMNGGMNGMWNNP